MGKVNYGVSRSAVENICNDLDDVLSEVEDNQANIPDNLSYSPTAELLKE